MFFYNIVWDTGQKQFKQGCPHGHQAQKASLGSERYVGCQRPRTLGSQKIYEEYKDHGDGVINTGT